MAGTIQPIAALTVEDRGPINTIVSIFLPITSILISTVRIAMRRQNQFDADDILFGLGLCFGVLTSILSHLCVRAGLGRHQNTLDPERVVLYFKLFWTTQLSGVIALALAKTSLALLYKRIFPKQIRPQTVQSLVPIIAVYTLLCLSLIGFQCQLPRPWILSPSQCSTHGNVYYPVTISNILTDALLAIWMFPIVWGLQITDQTKSILVWLFGSRLLICLVDMGRLIVIHKALQSEDQTRSQLLWAVMDQITVHLSINHATLPRIHTFLSHLQIGAMSIQIPATQGDTTAVAAESSVIARKERAQQRATTQPNESQPKRDGKVRIFGKIWNAVHDVVTGRLNRASSISEQPLKHYDGIELSTTIFAGKSEPVEWIVESNRSVPTSLSSETLIREDTAHQLGGVRVQKDIRVSYG